MDMAKLAAIAALLWVLGTAGVAPTPNEGQLPPPPTVQTAPSK